jgi:hypothetical protein
VSAVFPSPHCILFFTAKTREVSRTISPYTHFLAIEESLHGFLAYAADWDFCCADENVVRTLGKALEN